MKLMTGRLNSFIVALRTRNLLQRNVLRNTILGITHAVEVNFKTEVRNKHALKLVMKKDITKTRMK
jgi:hypothetical protein